ncbi:MAG: hypothetical protein WCY82_09205 [Desulfotomaculaceae bacterium]
MRTVDLRSDMLRALGGVLAGVFGPAIVRFVTHQDVSRADVEYAAEVIART